jgi:hypothetical protein
MTGTGGYRIPGPRGAIGAGLVAGLPITNTQASPDVSNMTESIASRADLPAQTTNWKAG